MKIYISHRPQSIGGGSNTFSWLFKRWCKKQRHKVVSNPTKADLAIIIAHLAHEEQIKLAKENGCYVVHRLDEYFEPNEDEVRREKHGQIIRLNRLADMTVFQSKFVFENVYPYIKPRSYKIIYNGNDPELFFPSEKLGEYIGHVTWGVGQRKRLDLLYKFVKTNPQEKFLLIGRHSESSFNFRLSNVILKGPVKRKKIARFFRMMKMFYYPSEKDPCPNTVIEAILCGVPVCYSDDGGTPELVKDCGEPLENVKMLLANLPIYRERCLRRKDLYFDDVFKEYLSCYKTPFKYEIES